MEKGVLLSCQSCERTQKIFTPDHSKEDAVSFAGILDGTHPMFVMDPRADATSPIGKCAACQSVFDATLFGFDPPS